MVEEAAGWRGKDERLGSPPVTVGVLVLPLRLPAPSTPFFQPRFLAELVVVVLVLHPLQPKPGKVLKHDVVICGIAWWWRGGVRQGLQPSFSTSHTPPGDRGAGAAAGLEVFARRDREGEVIGSSHG